MGVLEQVMQMKSQGSPDDQIMMALKEQGFSPREIRDALDQSRVKQAVSRNDEFANATPAPPTPSQSDSGETYTPYTPQTNEIPEEEMYTPSSESEYYYPQEEEFYSPESSAYSPEGYNTDVMIEIAEQVFLGKIKKVTKALSELNEFKALYQTRIENAIERIKRIESMIDNLQIAILEKIGSYGENLQSIKNEMSMMQNSFSKMLPSFAEKEKKKMKKES
jgi:DNA-binding transcriptional MerR regulator